ncbi:hypothetical protein DID88_005945 [Monilinia fructigena]|uniref:Uncharacterized protein n=1 Tax=Monilinia fructigena TaxID=38457 RepID=A0A395J2F3_9HELO|nr:hypothetical protein DID88_005945 [Monilinia fructigena]
MSVPSIAQTSRRHDTGYLPIENYGLIGNMRTCALVGIDGSIDFMCWPDFDSPSIFGRLLDKDKGGHFSITPAQGVTFNTKQQYLPSSNILQTRYIHEEGVVDLIDFFPRPNHSHVATKSFMPFRETTKVQGELKKWLVRRVECIRGSVDLDVEIFPAFNYARDEHDLEILMPEHPPGALESKTVTFASKDMKLQLDVTIDRGEENSESCPPLIFRRVRQKEGKGDGVVANIRLQEGQAISFVLRDDIPNHITRDVTTEILDTQQHDTQRFWSNWIGQSKYTGRWREVVARSLMILKLLTYEPTGAIIAAPTFSIPEDIGGVRMGFVGEADAYMNFISDRFRKSRGPDGALPIMFTIRGETDIPELELNHLSGYRDSGPVRIGNGAAFHQQFDIYGELMDAIYLWNKYGKPVTWDQWVAVREILDYVLKIWKEADMSIWEVRSRKQNYTYSKIMLWVAFDRGIRLSEKRCLPCPNKEEWLRVRDTIYEEIMEKGYNTEMQVFIQSYESRTMLDSSILIAPLVFFISPNDPRFLNTIDKILLSPEKGSEEIARSGEQLGNTPQAFSHLALISAAFNLDRVTKGKN